MSVAGSSSLTDSERALWGRETDPSLERVRFALWGILVHLYGPVCRVPGTLGEFPEALQTPNYGCLLILTHLQTRRLAGFPG